ncbi:MULTISPECIES: DUF4845 domain-containing protein [Xanthomonas]|uniref:DUF4845 domain-containing protein n=1 Tax=Xanthomonas cucurbitae TaxID=56453 RepID=A0A2S7DWF1_9XANT|nr:DUF4845 domain-containing protein [Xanthomonas cucurbitae]PPU78153.1 DUF4845 domain-containing protein [Xanthomonas cucurbitae]QHG86531.1 DUF4845 domain-containing protein [Xanthomonas cucurbitae]WDM68787.1 DUF4845 domain-containing protein [Xanthomonas cucurbitae]WDM72659.1 DUF4845 domain-containing protein [Xanthomonas cucurbitae]WDM76445.1 DUF4845 domain-containing protein [Xanthomonas cucurbitae]
MHARRARGSTMKRKQSGMTLTSFVVVLAVVGFGLYIGMKLFPMYQEYYSVRTAMKGLANEPGSANMDPSKLQDLFFRRLYINYSENVKKEDVKFERIDGGWRMKVNYEVRRELIGNLDIVGKFDTSEDMKGRSVE